MHTLSELHLIRNEPHTLFLDCAYTVQQICLCMGTWEELYRVVAMGVTFTWRHFHHWLVTIQWQYYWQCIHVCLSSTVLVVNLPLYVKWSCPIAESLCRMRMWSCDDHVMIMWLLTDTGNVSITAATLMPWPQWPFTPLTPSWWRDPRIAHSRYGTCRRHLNLESQSASSSVSGFSEGTVCSSKCLGVHRRLLSIWIMIVGILLDALFYLARANTGWGLYHAHYNNEAAVGPAGSHVFHVTSPGFSRGF